MNPTFEEAIRALEEARQKCTDDYREKMAQYDRGIAALRAMQAEAGNGSASKVHSITAVKPGQYEGMKAVGALQAYLLERGGGPISRTLAAKDLRLGGAEPEWTEERYARSLKIMIKNHTDKFRYDERNDTISLIAKKNIA